METIMTHPTNSTPNPIRRFVGATALLFGLILAAPAAHAQWQVNDADANIKLNDIRTNTSNTVDEAKNIVQQNKDMNSVLGTTSTGDGKTINANLDAINKKLVIGTYSDKQPGARVKNPEKVLPEDTTKLDDGKRCDAVAEPQQANCKLIVDLENAQYQYMLTMYKNTETRDAMLRELLKEREAIKPEDANQFGKLEDNTNKLTALYNLIALDQQQMQTVNYAYEANLRYLRSQQTLAANAASTGKKVDEWGSIKLPGIGDVNIGDAVSGLATGVALKGALDGVQSKKPEGMQTLKIGKSNGF
ncbi:hypothetical protein [Luteibacter sp. UNCMF331Sha3.1]|uniref:hypothetical protein n=1 Tax=Luteibacter sp. UNCMF331Sha3.1 TaxID=1502760 RepID=UPI000B7E0AE1|nr:hypothetical protein [Luteibacter sp. UNCMF331Sha3.1]